LTAVPPLGDALPQRGNRAARAVGRAALSLLGWEVEGEIPNLSKLVIAVAPHTSNWDFVVGIAAMFALDLRLTFLSKHTLFRGPFDAILRWMGGVPVDRSRAHGVVGDSVRAFAGAERLVLALAPEGTRKGASRFHLGFLHIARRAGVPVLLASLDYAARRVRLGPLFAPTADPEADRRKIEAHFAAVRGKRVRRGAPAVDL
jgi:1-acyl-sn-glycerol-3-phosphate acyltransferase